MAEEMNSSGRSSGGTAAGCLRLGIRLVFVLVVGVLVGLGLYFGVPWLYRRLVWPVQENSALIAFLEERVATNSDRITDNRRDLQERIVSLESELDALERRAATEAEDQEALAEDQQDLMEESREQAQRIRAVQEGLDAQGEAIEQGLADTSDAISDLEAEIAEIQQQVEESQRELSRRIEGTDEDLVDLEGQLDEAMARVSFLQTAQDLVKVRLLLMEENPGAARDTLQLAITHLTRAAELVPSQAEALGDLRQRMVDVDEEIAAGAFGARPSLEALWADVMGFVSPLTGRSTITETEVLSPVPTPTPSP